MLCYATRRDAMRRDRSYLRESTVARRETVDSHSDVALGEVKYTYQLAMIVVLLILIMVQYPLLYSTVTVP